MRIPMQLLLVVIIFCAVGCSKESTINKAIEQANYTILFPKYLPDELELVKSELENELLYLKFQNEKGSSRVEITQDYRTTLNLNELLEFVETGENPYDLSPSFSYKMIGEFVGEYSITPSVDAFHFTFIPIIPREEVDLYPYYNISAVGLMEEEFHQIVKSLLMQKG